jgi:4-diphosphocytidyl-2-C-methyl-D-erythritol kinase
MHGFADPRLVALARIEGAPAKINLTLRVIARRADGYHEIESLVAFAGVADQLTLTLGRSLALVVRGPMAAACGDVADNLVLEAAHALSERVPGLKVGRFQLSKRLPVAAGLGGGSSDAAAALRLLARANRLALDDPRLFEAAGATGADVPVCLEPQARIMRGIGDVLSDRIELPPLAAMLVNPGVAVATRDVFNALDRCSFSTQVSDVAPPHDLQTCIVRGGSLAALLAALRDRNNDLEKPAIRLQPVIADVLRATAASPGCRLARMSGSGATCFGLFETIRETILAARRVRAQHPIWWVRATTLGGLHTSP